MSSRQRKVSERAPARRPARQPSTPPAPAAAFCPRFHRAVELIGRRWSGAILRALMGGSKRFNEMLAEVPGLSDRLLSERLREFEAAGLVRRDVDAGPPVCVRYTLTPAGRDLEPVIGQLGTWAERWIK